MRHRRNLWRDLLATATLVGMVVVVFSISTPISYGQLLKRKVEPDAGKVEIADENDPDESADSPAWEKKFFMAWKAIDKAISDFEMALADADEVTNPIVQKDFRSDAKNIFSEAIRGHKLVVFFKLSDIEAGKKLSRYKQSFLVSLREPTFPSHRYSSEVTIVTSPTQARKLTIGAVVRVEGRLQEPDRDSFDRITFVRFQNKSPLTGDKQTPSISSRDRHQYTFDFHVDKVRVLSGKLLEEYQTFVPRYEAKLAEYATADR